MKGQKAADEVIRTFELRETMDRLLIEMEHNPSLKKKLISAIKAVKLGGSDKEINDNFDRNMLKNGFYRRV